MPYNNYAKEADVLLAGEYLLRTDVNVPEIRRTQRILKSVSREVLDGVADRSIKAKAPLIQQLGLGADGRLLLPAVEGKAELREARYFSKFVAYLKAYPTDPVNKELPKDIGELEQAFRSNSFKVNGRTRRLSRYLNDYLDILVFQRYMMNHEPREYPWQIFSSKMFAEAAAVSQQVLLTTNLLDFLLSAQEGACDYGSCHSLDGEHALGNVSFALNDTTLLAAVLRDTPTEYPFIKVGRSWVNVLNQGADVAVSRYYGNFTAVHGDRVMDYINGLTGQKEITKNYEVEKDQLDGAGNTGWGRHLEYAGFFDRVLPLLATSSTKRVMFVFPEAVCLGCGQDVATASKFRFLRCEQCGPYESARCSACNRCVGETEFQYYDDTVDPNIYCQTCYYNKYKECRDCCDIHPVEEMAAAYGGHVCKRCVKANDYVPCSNCKELKKYFHNRSKSICEECWDDHHLTCGWCGNTQFAPEERTVIRTCDKCKAKDAAVVQANTSARKWVSYDVTSLADNATYTFTVRQY